MLYKLYWDRRVTDREPSLCVAEPVIHAVEYGIDPAASANPYIASVKLLVVTENLVVKPLHSTPDYEMYHVRKLTLYLLFY
ncbi:hypothetical protein POVWA2_033340 [Plasmodium ovale wallikeri]|uniref:Uncharacterized protein n=1 Tax=Plasmodium ovale wallikeri TaxID=864142 RepID=A0A1A8Z083_PLAOA|nr:hypothetical protein POVWA1_034200 [Plasmodium ovale wallikeri]SBT37252.1 hypothetical protein POVWA2_033340 [Plasmodium ovale wallikeri]